MGSLENSREGMNVKWLGKKFVHSRREANRTLRRQYVRRERGNEAAMGQLLLLLDFSNSACGLTHGWALGGISIRQCPHS